MNRFRPALNAILGLLLLVQGVAVASGGGMITSAAGSAESAATAAMPCHGDPGSGEEQGCCDTDCPNMASCALGHIAIASLQTFGVVTTTLPAQPSSVAAPLTRPPPSLLRPPIALHL